ncbi:synaptonemal complex protein 1 [Mycoplasmopsis alligatoris]|uniref:Uncharacterized protein n=1 Tax=Mycoplasmopsis alligatoris A21JP2 TaxID=747682 RepID=D4XUY1_9BACT|nr:hypothetical protein [Mycoplasmopsis alligatoris]EFF41839.1 hypothetical protein MALL_0138 [Mycoplasmopsis alligatoris A21JP2]
MTRALNDFNNEVSFSPNSLKVEETKTTYDSRIQEIESKKTTLVSNKDDINNLIFYRIKEFKDSNASDAAKVEYEKLLQAINAKATTSTTRDEAEKLKEEVKKVDQQMLSPKTNTIITLEGYKTILLETAEENSAKTSIAEINKLIEAARAESDSSFNETRKTFYLETELNKIKAKTILYKDKLVSELQKEHDLTREGFSTDSINKFKAEINSLLAQIKALASANKTIYFETIEKVNKLKESTLSTRKQDLLNKLNLAKSLIMSTHSKDSITLYRSRIDELLQEVNDIVGEVTEIKSNDILKRLQEAKKILITYKEQIIRDLEKNKTLELVGAEENVKNTFKTTLENLLKQANEYQIITEASFNNFNSQLNEAKKLVLLNKEVITNLFKTTLDNRNRYTSESLTTFDKKVEELKKAIGTSEKISLDKYDELQTNYQNLKKDLITYREHLKGLLRKKAVSDFQYLTVDSKNKFVREFTGINNDLNNLDKVYDESNFVVEKERINSLPRLQTNAEKFKEVIAEYQKKFIEESKFYVPKYLDAFKIALKDKSSSLDKAQLTVEEFDQSERALKVESEKVWTYNDLFKDELTRVKGLNSTTYYTPESFDLFVDGLNRLEQNIQSEQLTVQTYLVYVENISELANERLYTHAEALHKQLEEIKKRHDPSFYSKSSYDEYKNEIDTFENTNFPTDKDKTEFTLSQYRAKKAELEAIDINLLDKQTPWKPWVLIGAAVLDSIAILVVLGLLIAKIAKK